MLKKFKSLKQSLTKTSTASDRINEQVWNEYRNRALSESAGLDVKTPSVAEIAKKHETSVEAIEAQLKKGIAVEAEHTTDPSKAREIALDHLGEIPDYYDRLGKMEHVALDESTRTEVQKHWNLFLKYDKLSDTDKSHLAKRNHHEQELNKHYKKLSPQEKNRMRLAESEDFQRMSLFEESYKVGDQVIAKEGPHKGALHTVIHVHDTGHVNIKPVHSRGRQNRYPLGAARAHPDQITRAPLQEDLKEIRRAISQKQGEHTQLAHLHGDTHPKTKKALKELGKLLGQQEDHYMKKWDDKLAARATKKALKESSELTEASKRSHYADKQERDPAKWVKNREKLFKHPEGLSNFGKKIKQKDPFDPFKLKKGISYKHVQEAFEAAKAKKTGTSGQQDPGQAEVSAPAPQADKKDNRPTPPKNSKKVEVKGPGPDDKFQPESIVTPLTTLPNQTPGIRS